MNRFSQSSNAFYPSLSNQRPMTSGKTLRGKIYSTGESFQPSNIYNNYRPQSSAIMMRSSSSSFRNTKGKLQTLNDRLSFLLDDVKQTRTDFKEMQLQLNLMKESLNKRGIDPIKSALTQEIKLLDKSIQIRRRSDLLKFEALHETCHALGRNSKEIKLQMEGINQHLYKIQNLLGYHGLRDRLRY